MNTDHYLEAANLIVEHWNSGTVLNSFPPELTPTAAVDGYRIQSLLSEVADTAAVGWKIAATAKAGQQHIGVPGPIAGRLLASRVHYGTSATTINVPFGNNRMRVAECEFAFVLGEALPASDTPYSRTDVMNAVLSIHPALEFPDSRFLRFDLVGEACLAADNACAHEFVLGEAATIDWRSIDLAQHATQLIKNDGPPDCGTGADVLGDPRDALTWLANNHARQGSGLKAGDIVTTGVCGIPVPIESGDTCIADLGPLGRVSARIM